MTLSLDLKCVQQTIIEIAECGRIPNQRRVEFFRGILVESAHAIVEQIVVNMTAVTGYAFSDEISFRSYQKSLEETAWFQCVRAQHFRRRASLWCNGI